MSRQVIHPSVWSCPDLTRLTLELHLAYLYLLPLADHYGRFEWNPLKIWQDVGQPRKLSQARLDKWLLGLWDQGIIGRYQADGQQLAYFAIFEGMSKGRRYKERYPAPTQETVVPRTGTIEPVFSTTPQEAAEAPEAPTAPPKPQKRPQNWLQEASGLAGGVPEAELEQEFALISRATNTTTRELLPVWAHYCRQVGTRAKPRDFRQNIVRWMESWQDREET